MAGILIKQVPAKLHERLRRRAARNHRSLTKEALAILEAALQERQDRPTLEQMDQIRIRGRRPLTDAIIRQARKAGRP